MGWKRQKERMLLVGRESAGFVEIGDKLAAITELADGLGVTTIVHALATSDRGCRKLRWRDVFGKSKHVEAVIFESENWIEGGDQKVELWLRESKTPRIFIRQFSRSSDSTRSKKNFMDLLPTRIIGGNKLLVVCGEVSIVKVPNTGPRRLLDEFNFLGWLKGSPARIILCPAHDHFVRWNMTWKKRLLSSAGRNSMVVGVWNRNLDRKIPGPKLPWSVDYGGRDYRNLVRPIDGSGIRDDLRLGLLEISC